MRINTLRMRRLLVGFTASLAFTTFACSSDKPASGGNGGATNNGGRGGSASAGAGGGGGQSTGSMGGAGGGGTGGAGGTAGNNQGGAGGQTGGSGGAGGAGGASAVDASGGTSGDAGGAGNDSGVVGGGTGCTAPGTLCFDFEDGKLPTGWTLYRNEFAGQLLVDNTKAHKGTYALHAKDLMGGALNAAGGPKKSARFDLPANFGPVLWGRAFVYTTPARPASHAGIFNARYPRPGMTGTTVDKLNWYEVATYKEKYMGIWHPPEPPGFPEWVLVSDKPLVLDNWACLEWLFDGANGTNPQAADPRVWVDGAELAWPERFVFSDPPTMTRPVQEKATNFTMVEVGAYLYQGLPTTTNWWIDDLAVGKQRIGCN